VAVAHTEAASNKLPPESEDGGRRPGSLCTTCRPEIVWDLLLRKMLRNESPKTKQHLGLYLKIVVVLLRIK
jgi:hypothetical protein